MLTPSQVASLPDSLVALMAELDEELVVRGAEMAVRGATAQQIQSQLEAIASTYTLRIKGTTATLVESAVSKTLAPSEALYASADLATVPSVTVPAITARAIKTAQAEALTLRSRALESRIVGVRQAIESSAQEVVAGNLTRQQATAKAVYEIGDSAAQFTYASPSGLRTVELESAVRQSIGTLAHRTSLEAQDSRMGELGVEYVLVSQHGGARPEHAAWQGQVYGYPDELEEVTGYPSDDLGLGGINCVVGDTLVSGPPASEAFKRLYTGEVVVLTTSAGDQLTVTPNHPILTNNGWVAAGLLCQGDKVVCQVAVDGEVGHVSPYSDKDIPRIEDVFRALSADVECVTLQVSPADFHGDGTDDDVDVVFADSHLLNNGHIGSISEQFGEDTLALADIERGFTLPTDSTLEQFALAGLPTSSSFMGSCCVSEPLLSGHAGVSDSDSLFSVALSDTNAGEQIPSRTARQTEVPGDVVLGQAVLVHTQSFELLRGSDLLAPISGKTEPVKSGHERLVTDSEVLPELFVAEPLVVEFRELVHIDRYHTTVHVYNLSTAGGWFTANTIITHNCRHSFSPYLPGVSPDPADVLDEEAVNDVYTGTQRQRTIERNLRHYKRRLGANDAALALDHDNLHLASQAKRDRELIAKWHKESRENVAKYDLTRRGYAERPTR